MSGLSLGDRVFRHAPRSYRIDDYKRWFPKTGRMFLRHLRHFDTLALPNTREAGGAIGVVVCPWVSTPIPWYAIMLAIGLARRGRKVTILWDATGFPEEHLDEQNRAIAEVLSYVGRFLPVLRLQNGSTQLPSAADAGLVDRLANQNLTWRLRGAPTTERDQPLLEEIRGSLTHSLPSIRNALDRADFDCLVVPGGVYGSSGLFFHEAEARGCRVATFDTDRRIAQICVSGIAAQGADLPRAFETLWNSEDEERRTAIVLARHEFQRRVESSDRYGFQAVPSQGVTSMGGDDILIPLNVEWDTAALGRHVHFADTIDWITSTVTAILDSDAGPVIVRQHPSERRRLQRSELDIATVLRNHFGDDPRCRFVAADDGVNTYDLLRSARLVLPFVSTIAIEAAAMGKPVLISGASYYADLGFVWSAQSRDEYFTLLRRGLRGDLEPWPDQSDRAWICYYLSAVRNRISTDFTPHPDDFWDWCHRVPGSVFADPEVSDILEAIDRGVPVSLIRHCRMSTSSGESRNRERG